MFKAAGQPVGQVFPQAGAFYMQPLAQVIAITLLLGRACFDWSQDNAKFLLVGFYIVF